MKKTTKQKLLGALFAEAKKVGLDAETLREYIAPEILDGKRLSEATPQEVSRVLENISRSNGLNGSNSVNGLEKKRYESSRSGLIEEIVDLARARYGNDFIVPLNNLCARFGESDGYRKMRIAGLKELKLRLIELNKEGHWQPGMKRIRQVKRDQELTG